MGVHPVLKASSVIRFQDRSAMAVREKECFASVLRSWSDMVVNSYYV